MVLQVPRGVRAEVSSTSDLWECEGADRGILRELCRQEGVEWVEGHAMPGHVHLCLSVPPKSSVAHTAGFLKGKSAVRIHRECLGRKKNFGGLHSWAKGYCVGTVGLDQRTIIRYDRHQEAEEQHLERLQIKGL
jgi:putative transposase